MARRLSILAGGGHLVNQSVDAALSDGWDLQLLAFTPRTDLDYCSPIPSSLSHPVRILINLRAFKPTHICMVGGLNISDKQRRGLFAFARKKKRSNSAVGDTGLSAFVGILEFLTGAKVIGVHELDKKLVAQTGLIAGPEINSKLMASCEFALGTARKIGALDIGQAVICSGNRIISVEDIAGTDALMNRVAAYVADELTGDADNPLILAKAKKPGQPSQVDLPAIGPETIITASAAGISVVVVEAGSTLLIDQQKMRSEANSLGVSVFGICSSQ